jgi:hypothetical protein
MANILNMMCKERKKRTARKIYIKIDITKTYDDLNRKELIEMLVTRVKTDLSRQAINLIASMYDG